LCQNFVPCTQTSWWYAQLHAWFEAAFWCTVKNIFAKVPSNFPIENMLVVSRYKPLDLKIV
jgi:hypothetical protein